VTGTDPGSAICDKPLTIKGRGFGAKRDAVDGEVRIAGREVSAYEQWSDTEIRVVVASNSQTGPELRVEVSTRGGADGIGLKVSC
jgi:hypothetical protein